MRSDRTARLRPHRFWLAVGAVTVAGAATAWFGLRLWAADPRVARGRQLYDAHCASCHGLKCQSASKFDPRSASNSDPA
ncbi:c-type cytochrome, partial [Microvirga sp. Mcv34]|uniref:c-type cytochrome n=1 Tax=Microvirga sp. Mcv34 TaxID=2926016 RepID=UPI0039673E1E